MTKLSLPDPGRPPTPTKTLTRWDSFLGELASGTALEEAMKRTYVCRADIETMCRLEDGGIQRQRWDDARLAGKKRAWTMFEFEEFFARIAQGLTVDAAMMAIKGVTADQTDVYYLMAMDADLRTRYKAAKEAHSLIIGESVIGIADDKTGDVLDGPKGPIPNTANVNRDKLRVDTRFRYIGSYNQKLFGEKKDNVNVQVNIDHAGRLEEARERALLQDKRVTPKQMTSAIDAVFSEKTAAAPAEDTSWMDDKPTDTMWREEQ